MCIRDRLYVNKGKPVFGAVLGFIESAIWVVAISRVIQDLNDPLLIFGYALGFASGTIMGSYIENTIAIGDIVVRIFAPKDSDSMEVARELRDKGFGPVQKTSVHASTLKSFIKDGLEKGISLDLDLLGGYVRNVASIGRKA